MLEKDDNNYSESLLPSRNSGEIMNTNSNSNILETKDSFEEQVDQDKVQVILQDLKAEYTTVSAILEGDALNFREKDKFDVVKFTIKVKAVYNYTWEVYRKPADIKKSFADIHSELSKNFMGILIIINKSNNLKFTMSAFNENLLGYKEAGLKDI